MIHAVIIEMKPNPAFEFGKDQELPFDSRWTYGTQVGTSILLMIDKDRLGDPRDADPNVAEGWDWHLVDLGL